MSFGVKKDFKNKRGSLGLHIIEPFNKYKVFSTNLKGDNFMTKKAFQVNAQTINVLDFEVIDHGQAIKVYKIKGISMSFLSKLKAQFYLFAAFLRSNF